MMGNEDINLSINGIAPYQSFHGLNELKIVSEFIYIFAVILLYCTVLCYTKVLLRLKGNFYHTTVKLVMLYGTKCWSVKNKHDSKISEEEMRCCIGVESVGWSVKNQHESKISVEKKMLRWMVWLDMIELEMSILESWGSTEKTLETLLWWFWHLERRPVDSVVRRVVKSLKAEEDLEKTIWETIKDLEINELYRDMIYHWTLWWCLIYVADLVR